MQPADMKQRHRHQRGGRIAAVDDHADALGGTHRAKRALKLQRHQRLTHCAVGREHAFGQTGGARGVENQRRIIGPDPCWRDAHERFSEQVVEAVAMRLQWRARRHAHHQRCEPLCAQVVGQQLQPWRITHPHLSVAVLQAMKQLITQTPAIERHTHRTATLDSGKRHQPGRLIAHGDGHPIAWAHTKTLHQLPGQTVHLIEKLAEAQPLLFPHQKFAVPVHPPAVDGRPYVGGGVAKILVTAARGFQHFIGRARADQLLPGALPLLKFHLVILQTLTAYG